MSFVIARHQMVELQLERRGITDPRVLAAFRKVPREAFVPANLVEFAYEDAPLPIGDGQTISQPYIVALTLQTMQLRGGERVLEIGTGAGYAAAVLSLLAKEVFTMERLTSLAEVARTRLQQLEYTNIRVLCGDGTLGWPEHAPYDAIAIAAGGPKIPQALKEQLELGGRLVIPVGPEESMQTLTRVTRESESRFAEEAIAEVRFVPLIGQEGWPEAQRSKPRAGVANQLRYAAHPPGRRKAIAG